MSSLYLLLNIGTVIIPFIFSFHPKLRFYKLWPLLFKGLFISFIIYLPWDILFTKNGVWGFNSDYLLGLNIIYLPIEEWLFFICIPYACVFTHYALLVYFPKMQLSIRNTKIISYGLITLLLITAIVNFNKWYTFINFLYGTILIGTAIRTKPYLLQHYYLTFLILLIPFFIINGVLTGNGIINEVVWYNNNENLGIRVSTIPIEDIIYAFTLILTCLITIELLQKKRDANASLYI